MQEKSIKIYDSYWNEGSTEAKEKRRKSRSNYAKQLFNFIKDEYKHKFNKKPLPNVGDWKLVPMVENIPSQTNSDDCGIFTCIYADFLLMNHDLKFDQSLITKSIGHTNITGRKYYNTCLKTSDIVKEFGIKIKIAFKVNALQ